MRPPSVYIRMMGRGKAPVQLRERDVRSMFEFIGELGSAKNVEEVTVAGVQGLRGLVSCDIAAYNELDLVAGTAAAVDDPTGAIPDFVPPIFAELGHQNPLVSRYARTRDGRPYKWSDFITRRELHRTELYQRTYAAMGIEHQIAFALPAPPELVLAYALSRERRDFSERDRCVLNLIRAPMIDAYRSVERFQAVSAALTAAEQGLERVGSGVVVLEPADGGARAARASAKAAELLGLETEQGELPAEVSEWLASSRAEATSRPLVLSYGEGGAAVVHHVPGRHGGDPEALLVASATLRAAGLTQRETQVLQIVAMGSTNQAAARRLSISPRTVERHLANIYDKLGARSRTQAIKAAWAISSGLTTVATTTPLG